MSFNIKRNSNQLERERRKIKKISSKYILDIKLQVVRCEDGGQCDSVVKLLIGIKIDGSLIHADDFISTAEYDEVHRMNIHWEKI